MGWIEIIDVSFSLYRRHFRHFLWLVVIYACVDALREVLLLFFWEYKAYHLLDHFISSLLYTFAMGLFLVMASEIYLDSPLPIREVFRKFTSHFSRYFGCSLAYLIPYHLWLLLSKIKEPPNIAIPLFVLISLPFIPYFLIAWILYGPVVMLESSIAQSPLRRSRELIKGAWWRVCNTFGAVHLLLTAIHVIVFLSYQVLAAAFGFLGDSTIVESLQNMIRTTFTPESVPAVSFSHALNRLIFVGIAVITVPVDALCVMLIYFNRRMAETGRGDMYSTEISNSLK